jgi:hypothetical protein
VRLVVVRLVVVRVGVGGGGQQRVVSGHLGGADDLALRSRDGLLDLRLVVDVTGVEHDVGGLDHRPLLRAEVQVVGVQAAAVEQVHLGPRCDPLGEPGEGVDRGDDRQVRAGGLVLCDDRLAGRARRPGAAGGRGHAEQGEGERPAVHGRSPSSSGADDRTSC